jgi:hypothetical protein
MSSDWDTFKGALLGSALGSGLSKGDLDRISEGVRRGMEEDRQAAEWESDKRALDQAWRAAPKAAITGLLREFHSKACEVILSSIEGFGLRADPSYAALADGLPQGILGDRRALLLLNLPFLGALNIYNLEPAAAGILSRYSHLVPGFHARELLYEIVRPYVDLYGRAKAPLPSLVPTGAQNLRSLLGDEASGLDKSEFEDGQARQWDEIISASVPACLWIEPGYISKICDNIEFLAKKAQGQ